MEHSRPQPTSTPQNQMPIKIVRTLAELDAILNDLRAEKKTIGFVPTMGALHDGHLSLIELAKRRASFAVVSIFVNPKQFGPSEDYVNYPRHEEADIAKCADLGADLVFLPSAEELYPFDHAPAANPGPAALGLESEFRPGFFNGVVSAVEQLFEAVKPDIAVFGEKDYQQLCVVRESFPKIKIIGAPTVRDEGGLALSSRNAYLSEDELKRARGLNKILFYLADEIRDFPQEVYDLIPMGIQHMIELGFDDVDYLELREEGTLDPMTLWNQKPARLLVAARMGKTRLIDNVRV